MANEFARTVWQWVRNRQICGQKFRREYPIPPYTADFCCVELKLILEIDGRDHFTEARQERDSERDEFLNREGYRVVRIAGFDVLRDGKEVLEMIREEVRKRMGEMKR
jgi:very-short-patch-repair endonuclease